MPPLPRTLPQPPALTHIPWVNVCAFHHTCYIYMCYSAWLIKPRQWWINLFRKPFNGLHQAKRSCFAVNRAHSFVLALQADRKVEWWGTHTSVHTNTHTHAKRASEAFIDAPHRKGGWRRKGGMGWFPWKLSSQHICMVPCCCPLPPASRSLIASNTGTENNSDPLITWSHLLIL